MGFHPFTIFNQNRGPIAERLFFKYPEQNFIWTRRSLWKNARCVAQVENFNQNNG
jgi:hypothetical protein